MMNRMKPFLSFTITLAALLFSPVCAQASDPQEIGKYGDWGVYVFQENGNKVCYIAARAQKTEGNYTRRGKEYALITHRPSEGTKNVFSYISGYSYKEESKVTVTIGKDTFKLFTQGETAWAPDEALDTRLAEALRKGNKMIIKGTSSRGTLTTDTYSLKGSGAAHDASKRECGI
jgi:invasion protein IalB